MANPSIYLGTTPIYDNYLGTTKIYNILTYSPPHKTMTVVINLTDSNPDTCCSYADDAVNMEAKSSAWDEFFGHYPVLFANGAEVVKLNPNNYAQDINGNTVDITSGSVGDVMVAFPRRGLRLNTSEDGNTLTISFTDIQDDSNFKYYAHQRGNTSFSTFYMGAYDGYVDDSGKLRSLSGKTPTASKTIGEFRTAAQLNGSGYEQFCFFQLLYLQCIYIMKYKSLNGQTSLGNGYVGGSAAQATGTLNANGLDYGSTANQTTAMKFAGIENFWGNIWKLTDGCVTDSSRAILTTTTGFNDSGNNYEFTATGPISDTYGYMITPQGTSEAGFIIKTSDGSNSTYFSDYAFCYASRVANFGGNWNSGPNAGPFVLQVYPSASNANLRIGARLSFFPIQ